MVCCENCFKDRELKSVIRGFDKRGDCSLCGMRDVYIYDTETDRENTLRVMFETITDAFEPYDKEHCKDVPKSQIRTLAQHLIRATDIFNLTVTKTAIFIEGLMPDKEYLKGKVVPRYTKRSGAGTSILNGKGWNEFIDLLKHKIRFGATKLLNDNAFEIALNNCTHILSKGLVLSRARILEGNVSLNLSEIGAPPEDKSQEGRVNPKGIRVLYLADSRKTALTECRARVMDEALLADFKLERDLKIIDLEKLSSLSPWSSSNDFSFYLQNIPFLKDVSSSFGKALNNYDNKLDYLGTQFVAEYARLNGWDGIAYGSTLRKTGKNYALFNPDDAKVQEESLEKVRILGVTPRWQKVATQANHLSGEEEKIISYIKQVVCDILNDRGPLSTTEIEDCFFRAGMGAPRGKNSIIKRVLTSLVNKGIVAVEGGRSRRMWRLLRE